MKTWKQIWESRNVDSVNINDKSILLQLIKNDGFDGGGGNSYITEESWMDYISLIEKELSMQESDSVFEVGCGSGAILYPLYKAGHSVGGLDWSETLIAKAQEILPDTDLTVSEALYLEIYPEYDYVIANSMFFYFPDYEYAKRVLNKMYQKAKKGVAILDVPDLRVKDILEGQRRAACLDYDEKYKGLMHLYYPQKWFLDFAEQNQCSKIIIRRQNIANYGYNGLRFNVFITK